MATTAFELVGRIVLEGGDRLQKELANLQAQSGGTGKSFSAMGTGLKAAGALIGGAVVGVGALGAATLKLGIGYNAMKEQSTVAWKTLLGSQGEAEKMMKNISAFAAATPFETADVDAMAKYMHNAGVEGEQLWKELTKASDVASAFAIPAASAKEMVRQMSQVRQAGVAYTEDLNILQDKGIPIYGAISKQLGITTADVKKLASQGKLSSDIYLKAFDSISKGVAGASDAQAHTFSGMISTLKDNAKILAGTLTEGIFAKAKGFVDTIGKLLVAINKGFEKGGIHGALEAVFPKATADAIIASVNAFVDVLKWILDNWKPIVAGLAGIYAGLVAFEIMSKIAAVMKLYREGMILATLAQKGFNLALLASPIGWVSVLIGVLIAAGVLLILHWDSVKVKLTQLWDKVSGVWNLIKDYTVTKFDEIKTYLTDIWTTITDTLGKAWDSLVSGLTGAWDTFKKSLTESFDAIKAKTDEIWNAIDTWVITISATITGLLLPTLVRLGVQSAITAASVIADWVAMGWSSTIEAAKVVASWVATGAAATAQAIVTTITAIPSIIASFVAMSLSAGINAAKVVASWVLMGAQAIATGIVYAAQSAIIVAKWVWMGAQATIQAFRMAAAWIIALGPVAWIIAAIVGLATLIILNWSTIKNKTVEIWNGIMSWLKNLWQDFKNIGSDLINGLLKGITGAWQAVKDKITELANGAKKLFTNIFSMKSPSKFTMYVGQMLGEGLASGIDGSTKTVLDSAKSMATSTMGALSGAFSPSMNLATAGAGGGSVAVGTGAGARYSVEIPLVVNGREIARAIAPNMDQELERQRQVRSRGSNG